MTNAIKLAAIHTSFPKLTDAANPASEYFDPAAPKKFMEANLERTMSYLHEAGMNHADLVCTHEDFVGMGHYIRDLDNPHIFKSLPEPVPGPITARLGEIAKKYSMYIAANYYERDADEIYNTSVLIGRNGEFIGKYRKVQLPVIEKWMVKGGKEFPVFDTDIGRIGFVTCYDMKFPETCRAVALNGADIIVHQTQGWGIVNHRIGEALVRVRAAENSVYMLVSKNISSRSAITSGGVARSCVIDNMGEILAEDCGDAESIVYAQFTPDYAIVSDHMDSLFTGVSSVKARTALEREPALYSVLTDQNASLLEQFKESKLAESPDDIKDVYRKWKEYEQDIQNNRPVKVKYHSTR